MKKGFVVLTSFVSASLFLLAPNSQATTPQSILTTCTDLNNHKTSVLKATQKSCHPFLAPATWHPQQSDSAAHAGTGFATLRICSSKNSAFTYQFIKNSCPKYQVTRDYWRSVTTPGIPLIASISARGYDSAVFTLSPMNETADAPIAYYLVTNIKTGQVNKLTPNNLSQLYLANLSALTSYTFQISAVSVDGISGSSSITPVITTGAVPVVVVAPGAAPLAAPAFTLSASAETKTVNTVATGFTITSTGGAIASFGISATPAGMSFSTSTGALSGTPTSVAAATAYTVTATNASGSATRTFTLTVTAIVYAVGDTGPGGGKIFYFATTPFVCGPTRTTTCTYLEVAPSGWNTGSDPFRTWAQSAPDNYILTAVNNDSSPETATATAIGWGYRNTRAIILQGNTATATSAAALADSYTVTVSSVVYDDWYLPSNDELNQMCKWARGQAWTSDATVCDNTGTLNSATYGASAAGFVADYYWSSSEEERRSAWQQNFFDGTQTSGGKGSITYLRPVRAF